MREGRPPNGLLCSRCLVSSLDAFSFSANYGYERRLNERGRPNSLYRCSSLPPLPRETNFGSCHSLLTSERKKNVKKVKINEKSV